IANRYRLLDESIRKGRIGTDAAISRYAWVGKDRRSLGIANLRAADPGLADDKTFSIPFTISTFSEDRDGDIVFPLGAQLDEYSLTPVVFFGHQETPYPIARSMSPDGRLTVWKEENRIRAVAYFDRGDPAAMFIYGKVKRGYLNACSMAFVPIEAYRRDL